MNSLDSRYLRLGDTFAHRFAVAGKYRFTIGGPGGIAPPSHHGGFEIVVAPESGTSSTTHYVAVSYADNTFAVDKPRLELKSNDVILWSTAQSATPGFAVSSESGPARFDSSDMPANSMYSHAFGVAGTYEWHSASDAKLCGTVTVTAPPACRGHEERAAYLVTLGKATLVMIDGLKAHPKKVSITLGQIVFFAVRSGHGVSVIDRALVAGAANKVSLQPAPV